MRDCICSLASPTQFIPSLERGRNEGNILIPNWSPTQPAANDVTVAHHHNLDSVPGASEAVNLCLAKAEDRKFETNGQKCEDLGWLCVPMAVTATGIWSDRSKEVLRKFADKIAFRNGVSKGESCF